MVASAASSEQICRVCGDWTCPGTCSTPSEPPPCSDPEPDPVSEWEARISDLLAAARGVRNARSLDALRTSLAGYERRWAAIREGRSDQALAAIIQNSPEIVVAPDQHPRFGGDRPEDSREVVSWDENRVLVRNEQGLQIDPRSRRLENELTARVEAVREAGSRDELQERLNALDQKKREIAAAYEAATDWLRTQAWYTGADSATHPRAFEASPTPWWQEDLPRRVRLMGYDRARILVRTASGDLKSIGIPKHPSLGMRVIRKLWPPSRNAFSSLERNPW
jgi:hypothetical protein